MSQSVSLSGQGSPQVSYSGCGSGSGSSGGQSTPTPTQQTSTPTNDFTLEFLEQLPGSDGNHFPQDFLSSLDANNGFNLNLLDTLWELNHDEKLWVLCLAGFLLINTISQKMRNQQHWRRNFWRVYVCVVYLPQIIIVKMTFCIEKIIKNKKNKEVPN